MSNNKKILVVLASSIFLGSALLVFYIGSGSGDPRLGLMIIVGLQSAILLGLLGVVYVVGRRAEIATNGVENLKASLELLDRNTNRNLEQVGTSLSRKLDSLELSSQARFQRVDQRLGRQGRRIEATYHGIEFNFGAMESTSGGVPLLTQMNATYEILDRTHAKLDRLRAEIDQSSKRLREQSAQLRLILEEHSKISSNKVLAAKAAVIEELLEGIDSLVSQSAGRELP